MVVEDDIEAPPVELPAEAVVDSDGEVAPVRVAVQGRAVAKDHFVEYPRERGADFVPRDADLVEPFEVVEALPGEVFHDQDAGFGPDDGRHDEGAGFGGDAREVRAHPVDVGGFGGEVKFLGEGGLDLVGEPFERVFGEEELYVTEGEAGQGDVEGDPFGEGGVLEFDGYSGSGVVSLVFERVRGEG